MLRTDPPQTRIAPIDSDSHPIRFEVEGRIYTRGREGEWYYGDVGVPVPGSRDLRLTDIYEPRTVAALAPGGDDFVMVPSEDVAVPELTWVRRDGSPVEVDGRGYYIVATTKWREHADAVCGVHAPELHGSPAERLAARAEREFRLAQMQAELAAARRAQAFGVAASQGVSRRRLAALVDLSPTRIQQIAEEASPTVEGLAAADEQAHWLLGAVARSPHVELAELQGADEQDARETEAAARRLIAAGLIVTGRSRDSLVLTERGRDYVQHGRKVNGRGRATPPAS